MPLQHFSAGFALTLVIYDAMLLCRHDFVVVETIDFYADEDAELPPPMTQRDVIILNKAGLEDEEPAEEEDANTAKDGKVRGCCCLHHTL